MIYTATQFRSQMYSILAKILDTGKPLDIELKGKRFRIVPLDRTDSKLARLKPHPEALKCQPDELLGLDWSDTWTGEKTLDLP